MAKEIAHFLAPEQLRPGVFVMLEVSWINHSFTLSNFKIRNDEQVRELRALKLARYRYDPDRSDPAPAPATPAVDMAASPTPSPPAPTIAAPAPELDPAALLQQVRQAAVAQWRGRVDKVERAFDQATATMKNLNRNLLARPKETLEEMGELLNQMIAALLDSADATLHVMGDKAGGEDVYFHSLNVTVLSMMLAKDLGLSPDQAREMGMGAMFHDIGLMDIPDKVLRKNPDDYNNAERSLRAMHVEYGLTIGRKIGLSAQALAVIAQHHEMADGSGYPKGIKLFGISAPARLVAVVNCYDNLCNPMDISKAMTPHETLSFMYTKRRDKFDTKMLQLMIRSLGVYPPGSIVQLSNDDLAVVTSVNPARPLRPWIMVYDPTVPKEQAVLLDMEQETDITITKAIRPAQLAPQVAAYLNPRKRVTYFFDGGDTPSSKTV